MSSALILYFECLNDPLEGNYEYPALQQLPAETLSIDAYSSAELVHLAIEALGKSERSLLIIDSRKGAATDRLFTLVNHASRIGSTVWWVGNHPMAQKVIAMTHGQKIDDLNRETVLKWVSEG